LYFLHQDVQHFAIVDSAGPLHDLGKRTVIPLPHESHQQLAISSHYPLGVVPAGDAETSADRNATESAGIPRNSGLYRNSVLPPPIGLQAFAFFWSFRAFRANAEGRNA
jgi:hypothetical protein